MAIFLIVVIIICIWGVRYNWGRNEYYENPLGEEHVRALRGILALEIVLGHTYGSVPDDDLLFLSSRIGVWPVGIFFLLSGYGLMTSFHKKDNYLKGFLKKRIGNIVLPFILVFVIEQVIYVVESYLIEHIIPDISIVTCVRRLGSFFYRDWFVCEILVIYILWYLLYKYVNEKSAFIVLMILVILLNVVGVMTGIGSRWYGSTACFLLGIFIERYEEEIKKHFSRSYWKLVLGIGFVFLAFAIIFVVNDKNVVLSAVCINVTCVFLCLLFVLLLMKFSVGNTITKFCGKISWEIYVTHRLCIRYIGILPVENTFLVMCLLFAIIIVLSYLLNRLCVLIRYRKRR